MIIENFDLLDKPSEHGFMPTMKAYILDKREGEGLRPLIVVCPGGGYCDVCEWWEGERAALEYTAAGFCAVTVNYRVSPHRYPSALCDAARAVAICREKAAEWQVDPHKIAIMGFSAGGHLAADLSVEWKNAAVFGEEAVASRLYRPDLSVLCYPVITAGEGRHAGSFCNLTGKTDPAAWQAHSLENLVDPDTPPAFLWHTYEDGAVPVVNSMLYAESLRKNGVPFELHIYEKGGHGLGTVCEKTCRNRPVDPKYPYNWVQNSICWMQNRFGL